ncbi:MAG TPA: protein translocase subunit SecD [Dermatophilaceae bacterium]|nr:protein translocase subunit SecD [Dermatophilaceae bacterium]
MAITPHNHAPVRTLLVMLVITLGLSGLLFAVSTWGEAGRTPKLGLDLEGGQQIILNPQVREGQPVNQEELAQAVDIIRARVDGQGVAEAQVSTLGDSVTVSIPGRFTQVQREALQRSSQMRFRPVLAVVPVEPVAAPTPSAPPTLPPTGSTPAPSVRPTAPGPLTTGGPAARRSMVLPRVPVTGSAQVAAPAPGPLATTPAPTPTPAKVPPTPVPAPAPAPGPAGTPTISAADAADPAKFVRFATDEAWLTPANSQRLEALDCANQPVYDPAREDLRAPAVSCDADGTAKYLLGPAVLLGGEIADANAAPETNTQGQPTGGYVVNLSTGGEARTKYAEVSKYMLPLAPPRNQLAVVLDNNVISAPAFRAAILDGNAQISGNFTAESAKLFADQLKFGALPMSFAFQSGEDISPTLGGDQLRKGLIAGIIGLGLVVLYSLFQYRVLGLVTVASLILVSLLTYLTLTLLGWSSNLRLTMAGITGAIVAIGTTADSFIVYFERVRDEVREGRAVHAAVQTGWARARRTILISDAVNFLAAAVLYLLASSNVRGFAFVLMLTTILDVVVVFLFTHPLLSVLATTSFFGGGHTWSGLDPERLGAKTVRYVGRGRVTIADQRVKGRKTASGAGAPAGAGVAPTPAEGSQA